MRRRIRNAARAETDIRQISRWIARDSVDAALKWLSDLDEKLLQLARTPGMGTDQSHLRRGMRSSPFGSYLIFFKKTGDGILIVRVLHGARDYRRFFK